MTYQSVFMEDLQPLQPLPHSSPAQYKMLGRGSSTSRVSPWIPTTRWTITLVLLSLAQCLACITLEAIIYAMFFEWLPWYRKVHGRYHSPITWEWAAPLMIAQLIAVVVESIYQFFLSIDTAKRRNIVQAFTMCTNNFFMLVFAALAWYLVAGEFDRDDIWAGNVMRVAYWLLIATLASVTLILGFVTWRLYREFSWAIYRRIAAADKKLRRRYLVYEIYIALMHLDFFFLFGFWVQSVLPLAVSRKAELQAELPVATVGLASTIPQLILAALSVRREWRIGQAITILVYLVDIAAVSYQLQFSWRMSQVDFSEFVDLALRMLCYAGIALILLVASVVMGVLCMRNFEQGLLLHHGKSNDCAFEEPQYNWNYRETSNGQLSSLKHPRRMIID